MRYIDLVNEELLKKFFKKYLSHKKISFCEMDVKNNSILVKYCYENRFYNKHKMYISDYHVSSTNGIWVTKLWKVFMFEKFGEKYLLDLQKEEMYIFDESNKYKPKSKRLEIERNIYEDRINKGIAEIRKIADKNRERV